MHSLFVNIRTAQFSVSFSHSFKQPAFLVNQVRFVLPRLMGTSAWIMDMFKRGQSAVNRLYGYYFKRPVQRYNIENRAFKLLDKIESKDFKPKPAPHEPITQQILRQIEREHPEVMEEIKSKPDELVRNVNKVRITSTDVLVEPERRDKAKLPVRTNSVKMPHFGVVEPKNVPPGKVTLSRIIHAVEARDKDPEEWTNEKVAEKYNMEVKNVEAVFEHFKPFHMYRPHVQEKEPWYAPHKVEKLVSGIISPATYKQYRESKIELMEEAERQATVARKKSISVKGAKAITDGKTSKPDNA